MKKGAIVRLVIWSVTALILIAILVCGIVFGGLFNATGWNFSIGANGHTYANADKYTVGGGSVADTINDIEIHWIDGKVNVESYDGDTVEISETPVEDDEFQLRYLTENGKLTIRYMESGWSFGITKSYNKELTLKVPATMISNLTELKIDSTSAKINISSVNASNKFEIDNVSGTINIKDVVTPKCDIDTVSGEINADNLKTDALECDTVSGDITAKGEIGKIDTDSTSGEVKVTSSICPTKVETDSVSGDVTITIPQGSGFTADFDSVSGDFNSDLAYKTQGGKRIFGDGSADYSFDSTSGDVTINTLTTTF